MEHITSRSNPLIAHIRKLIADKNYRRQAGETVFEGPKMLEEALKNGGRITKALQPEGRAFPPDLPEEVRRVSVPEDLFRWVCDTRTPQQPLFLCSTPGEGPPEELTGARYLVLDGIQDPGNVGAIWRTADAFGADGICLLDGCADPWGPKTLRATMGACFRLPLWEVTLQKLQVLLKGASIPLYATATRADSLQVQAVSLERAAVVIGSEGRGISEEVLEACQQSLHIPMRPRCESLNAAVAAAVVLWEMAR